MLTATLVAVAMPGVAQAAGVPPPPAPKGWKSCCGALTIPGSYVYQSFTGGGCLYTAATPGLGADINGGPGEPRVQDYSSIDWALNGTACADRNKQIGGGDFHQVVWLYYYDTTIWDWVISNQFDTWNPGPTSHAIRLDVAFSVPPSWDPGASNNGRWWTDFGMHTSTADIYGNGYGNWRNTTGNLQIYPG